MSPALLLQLAPWLAAAAAGAALSAAATWPLARAPLQTALADLRTQNAALRETHAETARLAALSASARLMQAQASGQAASERLAAVLNTNAQLTEEKRRALQAATDGRACLSERALRLLDGAPGLRVSGAAAAVPPAPGQFAAAPAAAAPPADLAADLAGRVSTDADLGAWALAAGQQHEACRTQLTELIGWVRANTQPPPTPLATQEPRREPAP
jgi:hypothetical protein